MDPAAAQPAISQPAISQSGAVRTGDAQTNAPQAMVRSGKFLMRDGAAIYRNVCAACHMTDARGAIGSAAYPALAGNPRVASAAYPIRVIIYGQKAMPPFGALFDNDQIAAVVNYVRSNFGNHYTGKVSAADVQAQR